MNFTIMTLGYSLCDGYLLLGRKKRGFGCGLLNGYGGKVLPSDETIMAGAIREFQEETGLMTIRDIEWRGCAVIQFLDATPTIELHYFFVLDWDGYPVETEEMTPVEVPLHDIPYDQMWPNDRLILPRLLNGDIILGELYFDNPIYRTLLSSRVVP